MRNLLYILIVFDFIIRPFVWKIVEYYTFDDSPISYKAYWISDCATYLIFYLLIKNKDKIADDYVSQLIIWGALPFAVNKLFESIFFYKSKLDWTEVLAGIVTGVIVIYRINLHKHPERTVRNWWLKLK